MRKLAYRICENKGAADGTRLCFCYINSKIVQSLYFPYVLAILMFDNACLLTKVVSFQTIVYSWRLPMPTKTSLSLPCVQMNKPLQHSGKK